ncbi:hypothetical protein [Geodermatophilus sp. TF02-6]|uniref:hypothetical protein n=1 Tax=Geodermatophilus sp. TF02-6 TaxID=2250575 RepID=UPI0011BE6779|nr:hypothetical protein [Geodermatophilus sp. TF02-6]
MVLAAVAVSVWISVGAALSGGGLHPEVLRSDLRSVTPFTAVLLGVPALLALLAGHTAARSTPPGQRTAWG